MWLIKRPQHILLFLEANFPATTSECVSELFIQILCIWGLLEKYPTFGREKEIGLLGALDT